MGGDRHRCRFRGFARHPPRATNVRQMGDFLFLSGLAAPEQRQIIWSGINDITMWTVGTNLCDMQEFPDGGPVQGVAGAEIGYVVQDRAIRTMQFLPGDTTFIFNFSRVLHDRGSISLYGFSSIGNVLYFVSEDGFYSLTGQQVTPIGQDKVNRMVAGSFRYRPAQCGALHCAGEQAARGVGAITPPRLHSATIGRSSLIGRTAAGRAPVIEADVWA